MKPDASESVGGDAADRTAVVGPAAGGEVSIAMVLLARWLLGIFFRQVEVVDGDNVPAEGPVVFVANHVNSLVDPALLLGFLGRRPRFLAKSTLWQMAILRPFLKLSASIPVYRRQDAGVDTSKNEQTFSRCHEVLAAGSTIALFPEGTSHNEPALVPLRTGVSRIVLEAEERFPGLGVQIVPVGLTFDAKTRFRSRALIVVGEPLSAATELEIYGEDPRRAVRGLTERIAEGLRDVTLNFPSWDTARLIERAAEIYERPRVDLPAERRLSEHFPVRKAFIQGYRELQQRLPLQVDAVAKAVEEYDELLSDLRLTDRQVASSYPSEGSVRFVLKSLFVLGVRLPLAAVGTVYNILPYQVAGWLSRRNVESIDVTATYKLLASMLVYPITWLFASSAVAWQWGGWAGLAVFVLGPLSGYFALRFAERRDHLLRQVRAFFLLKGSRRRTQRLKLLPAAVGERLDELVQLHEATSQDPP